MDKGRTLKSSIFTLVALCSHTLAGFALNILNDKISLYISTESNCMLVLHMIKLRGTVADNAFVSSQNV